LIKDVKGLEAALQERFPEHQLQPRLDATARAASLLGDPQNSYRIIHVTGTNGKTSTSRMIERLLREHSLRTGRFTSPHLIKINERFAIDGANVDDEKLVEMWNDIEPILKLVDAELEAEGEAKITYFEALTLLAFAIFADAPVDVLVLEVGMGGLWDSTNIANADVAVFTPIDLDHTERLGSTIEEIAATKAGIIKHDSIVVSANQPAAAKQQLIEKASEFSAPTFWYGKDFEADHLVSHAGGTGFTIRGIAGKYPELVMPLHGIHQAENAALALAAVEAFLGAGERRILDDIVRVAFADASSPGRMQVVDREPLTILDGAHNPAGAKVLAHGLEKAFAAPRAIGVIGILAGKNVDEILVELVGSFERVVITKAKSDRSIAVDELATLACKYWGEENVETASSVVLALQKSREILTENKLDAIVVTGSLTVVGEALANIQEQLGED